jgi:hypothetical protein
MDEHDLDLFVEYVIRNQYVNADFKKHLQMYACFYREYTNKKAKAAPQDIKEAVENIA